MDAPGGNFAGEAMEMVSEGVNNASAELRKRRSTRIVEAVSLVVTGVDGVGGTFVERTFSLIINCHGCRYKSKHYVLKNMWVTMEIPHPETGQPPRTVRGRVAWIQRPRTVRQLFQVALELEVSGNVWGIGFPPEDWTAFPELTQVVMKLDAAPETSPLPPPVAEPDAAPHLHEAERTTVAGATTPAAHARADDERLARRRSPAQRPRPAAGKHGGVSANRLPGGRGNGCPLEDPVGAVGSTNCCARRVSDTGA